MGLESTVTDIDDLNPAWPAPADAKSDGDDHIRELKKALLNDFAGYTGAIACTGTDGGAANAYTITPQNALPAYGLRMNVVFSPTVANTGASTLNVSGLGAKLLRAVDGAELVLGDLAVGTVYAACYNGAEFRLLSVTKQYLDQKAFATALPAQSLGFMRSDGAVAGFTVTHTGYAQNEVKGADIASAATINLTTATGNLLHVTGTTTITAITIPSGAEREVVFDGALTLTNGASLILPTGANIVTAAGDTMRVRGDGAGVARVVDYCRANGSALMRPAMLLVAGPLTPGVAANIDFLNVCSSKYDEYLVQIDGVTSTAADLLALRFAIAGVVDAGTNYQYCALDTPSVGQSNVSGIVIAAPSTSGAPISATVRISGVNAAIANFKAVNSLSFASGTPTAQGLAGTHQAANVASGFRLYWRNGANFNAAGTIKVYGVVNS
jgi:hypothetical protein